MKCTIIRESFFLLKMCFKNIVQFIYGYYRICKLNQPVISMFGGKWVSADSPYAKEAFELARKCAEHNMSIITGGGPGAMEAAQCGAVTDAKLIAKQTLGIAVSGVDAEFITYCKSPFITVDYLYVRKWLLIRYSQAYIVFPGGIGTMDELFEIFNEVKLKKHVGLVIIFGSEYWKPLIEWFERAIKQGLVREEFRSIYVLTDDINYAIQLILKTVQKKAPIK